MRSPTLSGRYVNTVPASVRCTPSTRMSRMTNGWMASDGKEAASASRKARRENKLRACFKISAGEQSIEGVVEGEEGEAEEHREAETLAHLHHALRDRAALHDFGEILHQGPSIEDRNW